MNIYQKLIEVRKAVPFLKKENEGYQFKYVSSSQTLAALREAMDANGLILIPKVLSERVQDHTTDRGKHSYFTILNIEFTWVNADNPDEKIVCPWAGQGLDEGEKGVGKALTYAEKYFMLKFFNVPTDKDDPDADQKKPEAPGTRAPAQRKPPTQKGPSAAEKTTPPPTAGAPTDGKLDPRQQDAKQPTHSPTGEPYLPMGSPLHKKIEALLHESGIDRDTFKEWLLSMNWIARSAQDGQPSLATLTTKNASKIVDQWGQAVASIKASKPSRRAA